MAKHFQHFKTTQGYFSVWKNFFYLETERFLPITGAKSRKSDGNWQNWFQTRVWAILSALAQVLRPKGDVSTWKKLLGVWVRLKLSEIIWCRCNHLSQQWKPQQPPSNFSERSNARVAREKRHGSKAEAVGGKWELVNSSASQLTHTFACHSKWRGCSQSIKFLGNGARSVTVSQLAVRIMRKNSSTSPFSPISTNTYELTTLRHTHVLDLKKSSHTRDTMTLKCTLRWLLFFRTMLPSPRIRWTRHLYESASFWIRSPEWTFLNTLWIRNRVDAKPRYFFHPVT